MDFTGCIFCWTLTLTNISFLNIWKHTGIIVEWDMNDFLNSYIIDYGTYNGDKVGKHNIRCITLRRAMSLSGIKEIYINDSIRVYGVKEYYDNKHNPTYIAINNMSGCGKYNILWSNCQHYVRTCINMQYLSELYAIAICSPMLIVVCIIYDLYITLYSTFGAIIIIALVSFYFNIVICNKRWKLDENNSIFKV